MAESPSRSSDSASLRFRFRVPPADESSIRWLEAQENISFSLRMLIHKAIEADGYVDVINKPVAQLPRRGRPPGMSDIDDQQSGQSTQPVIVAATAGEDRTDPEPIERQEPVDPDQRSAQQIEGAPRQRSIDEIMSSTRR